MRKFWLSGTIWGQGKTKPLSTGMRVSRLVAAIAVLAMLSHLAGPSRESFESEVHLDEAAKHSARAAKQNPNFETLQRARDLAWLNGDYPAAFDFGVELLDWAKAQGNQEELAIAMNEHAVTLRAQGQYRQAEELYRQALEIDHVATGHALSGRANLLNNLALAVEEQGRWDEAEGLYRQALDIDRTTIGEVHPAYAAHLNNLAGVIRKQGRLDEAAVLFRQALDVTHTALGENHPDYANRLNNFGLVLYDQGKIDEARDNLKAALAIWRARLGDRHPDTQASIEDVLHLLTTHFPDDPQIATLKALQTPSP
jgi:tetratricopeptide (TPR) repeat protein